MNNLSIQLIVNPQCQLVSIDNTSYCNLTTKDGCMLDDVTKHVSLEFLTDYDGDIEDSTIVIKKYMHKNDENGNKITHIKFPQDGVHTYYKFFIPDLEHLVASNENDEYDSILIKDQTFYYKGSFYIGKQSVTEGISGDDPCEIVNNNIDKILSSDYSEKISSYLDIWESIKDNNSTQTFSFQKIVFSVCKLQKCLVNLQRAMMKGSSSCDENCSTSNSSRYKRDFLLSSLYVFDYLKDNKNYDEAQRILDNLTSCAGLCEDDLNNNKDCGCGSTKY